MCVRACLCMVVCVWLVACMCACCCCAYSGAGFAFHGKVKLRRMFCLSITTEICNATPPTASLTFSLFPIYAFFPFVYLHTQHHEHTGCPHTSRRGYGQVCAHRRLLIAAQRTETRGWSRLRFLLTLQACAREYKRVRRSLFSIHTRLTRSDGNLGRKRETWVQTDAYGRELVKPD